MKVLKLRKLLKLTETWRRGRERWREEMAMEEEADTKSKPFGVSGTTPEHCQRMIDHSLSRRQ